MTATRKKQASAKGAKNFYAGERTIVHLRLPKAIKDGLRARGLQKDLFKNELWDQVCEWFLKNPPRPGSRAYEHLEKVEGYTTIWIASPIVEKLLKLAERDQMSLARVIHTAAARYLVKAKK